MSAPTTRKPTPTEADDAITDQLNALIEDDSYLLNKARTEFEATAQRCPPKPQ